jgi:hypothetical protein
MSLREKMLIAFALSASFSNGGSFYDKNLLDLVRRLEED